MNAIAVFCGSSPGKDTDYMRAAYGVGRYLANNGKLLVYGGGKVGLMGQVAQGALDHDGTVIGVMPHFLRRKEVHHTGLGKLILVDNMHERKWKMHQLSGAAIMLPGGFGTFEEFFEMLTWAQLGLHQKPLGILNLKGFYDPLMEMFDRMVSSGFLKEENRNMVLVGSTMEDVMQKMASYQPIDVSKWINDKSR